MTPIQSSKTVFFDNSGNVLENGYIYIGHPSTNPQVSGNQKPVTFEDSSGYQFTASQPLRTIAGRIVYNGRPITALVDGVHSMLILNSASVQIEYTASITPSDTAGTVDLSDTIRVGLTLDAVKAFDVVVGDVVRSVGSATATDGLGADWLTISATGGAGDDVDLIDFDNGLQGQRDVSKLYRREDIGTHVLDSPVAIISSTDATAYRNVWTSVNLNPSVPNTAHAALVRVDLSTVYPSSAIAASTSVFAYARPTGSGLSTVAATRVGRAYNQTNANNTIPVGFVNDFVIKLNGTAATFDIQIIVNDPSSGSNNTTPDLYVSVIGYIVNPE